MKISAAPMKMKTKTPEPHRGPHRNGAIRVYTSGRILGAMMTPTRTLRSIASTLIVAAGLGLGVAGVTVAAQPAGAQDRGPQQRVLKGRVEDKSGTPIKGAIVYLRDGHTSAVKSAITVEDGTYRFVQLQQGVDYDVWAQSDEKKSKTKQISSFDSKNDLTITLTIDK